MSVPKEVTVFLDGLIGKSPQTRDNYDSFARAFWSYVKGKAPKDVSVEEIMAFLNDGVANRHWKMSTMKQYATLCLFFMGEFREEAFMKKLRKQFRQLPRLQSRAALYEGIYIPP